MDPVLQNGARQVSLVTTFAVLTAVMFGAFFAAVPAFGQEDGQGLAEQGDFFRSVKVGGVERTFLIHIPKSADPTKPKPLVLAYHGALMNAGLMKHGSRLAACADKNGFVVVFPNGYGYHFVRRWNSGGMDILNIPESSEIDFTTSMIEWISKHTAIDKQRIYGTGFSNGAMMCHRIATERPRLFAAIAAVGGTLPCAPGQPERCVPVMQVHGTHDRVIAYGPPYTGIYGPGFLFTATETSQAWAKVHGVIEQKHESTIDQVNDGTSIVRTTYGEPGKEPVVFVTMKGAGHGWPGGASIAFSGRICHDISNDEIWEFLSQYQLPAKDLR